MATLLAIPLSRYLSYALGVTVLRVPLDHIVSLSGIALWLVLVIFLAAIASIIPARNASKLSVRETLVHE